MYDTNIIPIEGELKAHNRYWSCQNNTGSSNRHGHKNTDSESPIVQDHKHKLKNYKF